MRLPRPFLHGASGVSLLEVLVVLVILGLLAGVSIGPIREALGRARLRSAVAELSRRMLAARWRAVAGRAAVGLRFEQEGSAWRVVTYVDGDADGIRSADIESGKDQRNGTIYRPHEGRPGVRFGLPAGPSIPRIPPSRGWLNEGEDPIRFGRSEIVSFSPLGGVTPGTVYLTDSEGRLAALVLFGATARMRIRFFHRASGEWRP